MAYYYKYEFVSPQGIYAIVKEELKSYFDTGMIDDLMFATYTQKCLKRLGKSSYDIQQEILYMEDFSARLPDNFHSAREIWLCSEIPLRSYQAPNAFYSQAVTATTIQVSPIVSNECVDPECQTPGCDGSCMPDMIQTVYKTTGEVARSYKRMYLLTPGNISARSQCEYVNSSQASKHDSFDIRDGKLYTNIRSGVIYMVFYATEDDDCGNILIPDNLRIQEYIEMYIKYKLFESLSNQVTDETFNQIEKKMIYYKSLSDEAFIMAGIEVKKQDIHQKIKGIKSNANRFQMYELASSTDRYKRQ